MKFENLELEWKGHAGVFIKDHNIYIDPYKIGEDNDAGDIVLLTHPHYDHCPIEDLEKVLKDGTVVICPPDCQSKLTRIDKRIELEIMTPGQEKKFNDVEVKAVPAYNLEKGFHPKGEMWNGYLIKIDNLIIYHAGDTDVIPEMSDLGENIDLALLPVGGKFTMNVEEAVKAATLLKPKLSIPIHWGEIVGSKEDAERFVELVREEGFEAEILEKK